MPTAALFDLDGVLVDTEGQYTLFWAEVGKRDFPHIPDFATRIKGRTLVQIFKEYYDGQTDRQAQVSEELVRFEKTMEFPFIPGALDFVRSLRSHGFRTAVVTSSDQNKMACLLAAHPDFPSLFDHIFTAEDALRSKPAPDCYLHAARFFGFDAKDCFVFEDSLNGLRAGHASGATVVALTTGLSADTVRPFSRHAMPDFTEANRIGAEAFFQQLKD